jgi:uncharacterized alkaline shock family protein YloU
MIKNMPKGFYRRNFTMADNKQYITQVQDNGRVMISEAVISTIVFQSLNDIEGYVGLSAKPGSDIVELVGKKNWGKGIKVTISESDELSIECNVIISYGHSVVTVATAIQEAIVAALQSMTGVTVVSVNVNVCGIVRQ